jgi:hypothetical protein
MTLTLDLPDELARQLAEFLPEGERDRFALAAIADALAARQLQDDGRLADALLADLDPELEPDREAAECRSAVEEGLSATDLGGDHITFDDARRRWQRKAGQQAPGRS